MVAETAAAVNVPLIGIGGIASASDALEFLIAGASAVQIGTANYYDPRVTMKIIDDLSKYCDNTGLAHISELTGSLLRP